MIFCLCAAGAYGIEEMIPEAGAGLTIVMLLVLPIVWSTPFAFVAAELGSARPQEGGYYKWVQEACGEFLGIPGRLVENHFYLRRSDTLCHPGRRLSCKYF